VTLKILSLYVAREFIRDHIRSIDSRCVPPKNSDSSTHVRVIISVNDTTVGNFQFKEFRTIRDPFRYSPIT